MPGPRKAKSCTGMLTERAVSYAYRSKLPASAFLITVTQGVDKSSLHVTHKPGHLVHVVEIDP